jgi:polysaccharide export outer membrane protein
MRILRAVLLAVLCVTLAVPLAHAQTQPPPSYRIGVDDILAVTVWDNKDLDETAFVRPDGKISLPLLGEIQAEGLTVTELAAQLNEQYGKTVKGAQATVLIKEIRSRPIFFVGGVPKSGPMQLTQDLTLLQAISLAGGLSPGADIESAFVLRGDERIPIDFVKLIQKGDVTQNIKLKPRDTIVIPVADVVYIQGEVKTPGPVRLTKDLTVLRAIAQAGGFTPLAAPKRVDVVRVQGQKKETVRVNVNDIMSGSASAQDMPLQANDIVLVPQRLF